jgi:predicted CXXCH cytochrome family protein
MVPRKFITLSGLLVAAILGWVFWLIQPAYADDPPPPDLACRGCHVGNPDQLTLPSGETLSLDANEAILSQSVHGLSAAEAVYCTDCHQPRTRYQYPHQPNPADTRQEFAADMAENCEDCHDPLEKHNPGHLLAWDNPDVPTCTACHGGHDVEPAEILAADPIAMCQSCHQTYEDPQVAETHQELVANLQANQTCQTCHGDTPTYPPDEQCKTCHSLLQSELTLASGETIPLRVEPGVIEDSIHGQHQVDSYEYSALLCTDCHSDQADYGFPHQPVTAPSARHYTIEMSNLCQECHPAVYDQQQDSIHAMDLAAGKLEAATCVDCHGSHKIQEPDQPREHISQTCAQCHAAIYEAYATSVHGAALLGEHNPDVPVCTDCHGVHLIEDPTTAMFRLSSPRLCAGCHADEQMMNKYDISTNVFETYVADFHGTTVRLFENESPDQPINQAVCYDCHGVHNILPATDENSPIIKQNLLDTCRQCHPNASAGFSNAWTSHFEPSLEHNPLIYLVNLFYAIIIPLVIGGFLIFIGADIYRRVQNRWRRQKEAAS